MKAKTIAWCVLCGAAYMLLKRTTSKTMSGLPVASNATPEQACAQWNGTFSTGTVNREPLCRRRGIISIRRRAYLPADTVEIVPGIVVRDNSLPTPVNGKCPKKYDFFQFSDGHAACLRKCPPVQHFYGEGISYERVMRNRRTGRCTFISPEAVSISTGGDGGGGE